MSSNISIQRICEYCKQPFAAKTTVTRFCSTKCNTSNYKYNLKQQKISDSNQESSLMMKKTSEPIKDKDFLTVKDACTLLNISLRTMYRLIASKKMNSFNFSERKTLIRRKDIEHYFDVNFRNVARDRSHLKNEIRPESAYTIQQIQSKFNISSAALYNLILKLNIPKKKHGRFTLVDRKHIDKVLS